MPDTPLRTVKGYDLRERIGKGGFGEVYRAYQPVVEREVAIKIILPEYASQPDFIRTFENEARLVARLEHPHIVPLFDYWRDPDGAYLVMRWLRGGSLSQKIATGALPLEDVQRILDHLTAALATAHHSGVIHRDLKPDNVLLDKEGNAYLTDFGIARAAGYEPDDDSFSGSLAYVSPEQLRSEAPIPQMDIYSLGVMLYEMLTGQHPFAGCTPSELIMKHLHDLLPALQVLRPDVPEALNQVIWKATEKQAADRYADVRQVWRDFQHALMVATEEMQALTWDESGLTSPYKGLRAFDEADAEDFFGRETLVEQLICRLKDERFLAVVGPSGCGKSSVVRAGLLPALRRGELPESDTWFMVTMLPGEKPVEALADALLSVAATAPVKLVGPLQADVRALDGLVSQLVSTELILVIDQFEEVFTLVHQEAERVHFLKLLYTAVTAEHSRLRVIITLRADFMDKPLHYPELGDLLRRHLELVLPLNAAELESAITHPAYRVGLRVDSNLIAAMVADIREEPGALPLLQYALTEVYERREGRYLTLPGYQASGGVSGALARRAEEVYQALTPPQQNTLRQILLRLVIPGEGTEDTRRRVALAELNELGSSHALTDGSDRMAGLDVFGQYRLLTFDRDADTRAPTVEVAHEALIRTWDRLHNWLDVSREDIRHQRLLANAASDWQKAARDGTYLFQGTRLAQYEEWHSTTGIALTPHEREFLSASLAERDAKRARDEARKAHEAALERRSRTMLRALAGVFGIAAVIAIALSVFAFDRSQEAQNARSTSDRNVTAAVAAQSTSDTNVTIAVAAVATSTYALGQAEKGSTEVAAQAATSDSNLRSAWDTQALFLADLSRQELEQGSPPNALRLALQSLTHYNDGIFPPASSAALMNVLNYPARELLEIPGQEFVERASWNSAGTRILTLFLDGTVRVSSASGDTNTVTLHSDYRIEGVIWNSTGTRILSWEDNAVRVWDAESGIELLLLNHLHQGYVKGAVWSEDETRILAWSSTESLWIWDATDKGHNDNPLLTLTFDARLNEAAWNHDGTRILAWSDEGSLKVWDAQSGDSLLMLQHEDAVNGAVWNNDGTRILSWSQDSTVRIWDADHGDELLTLHYEHEVGGAAWNADETALLAWSGKTLQAWDIVGDKDRLSVNYTYDVNGAVWNKDGTLILAWSDDGTTRIWDTVFRVNQLTLYSGEGVRGAAWNQAETLILSWSSYTAQVWDATYGGEASTPLVALRHENFMDGAAWNEKGTQILSWSRDMTVRVWAIERPGSHALLTFHHSSAVNGAVWSQDTQQILSWSQDVTVRTWDADSGEALLRQRYSYVNGAVWNEARTRILVWSGDGTVQVWDADTGATRLTLQHAGMVMGAGWNRAETRILSWSGSPFDKATGNRVQVWDAQSGDVLLTLQHEGEVNGAAWNTDETRILSWSKDGTACIRDAHDGTILLTLQHEDEVNGAAWNTDETRVLSWSSSTVKIWETSTGAELTTLPHESIVEGAVWNHAGTHILTWAGATVRVWDVASATALLTWDNEAGAASGIAYVVSGVQWNKAETLLLVWSNTSVQVVDATTGTPMMTFYHDNQVNGAAWDESETKILSWSDDGTVRVWDAQFLHYLQLAQSWAARIPPLNNEERMRFFLPALAATGTPGS